MEEKRYEDVELGPMTAAEPVAATLSVKTDEVGRIMLTKNMREAVVRAERDMEEGKCLSESDFKERFAKWL